MARFKSKTVFRFKINEQGIIDGLPDDWRERIGSKYSGDNVRMEIKIDEKPKSIPQLGYFFGVVLPYYMYGLIKAGNEGLMIGNDTDEKIVEKHLKDKHLKVEDYWVAKKRYEVFAPTKIGSLTVVKINKKEFIESKGPLVLFKRENGSDIPWRSPYKGELEMLVDVGSVVEAGGKIAHVMGLEKIEVPPSLADASVKDVINMIDSIKKESLIFFGLEIPDADPFYDKDVKLKNVLNEKLKGVRYIDCENCGKGFEIPATDDSDYKFCKKCLLA